MMEKVIESNGNDLAMIENYKMMIDISDIIFHDFKNILATISGLAQLSMLKTKSDEVMTNLNDITKATFDLRDSLNRYYQTIHGFKTEKSTLCLLYKLIGDALDLIHFKFEMLNLSNHKINLLFNINSNARVFCCEHELKQSFVNLLMNSLEAMEDLGGNLRIEMYDVDDRVYVDIIDSGVGISKENMAKLFKTTFTTKDKGTGLGLKIAKGSIEKYGGTLDISSEMGIGTMINISLPISKEGSNQ